MPPKRQNDAVRRRNSAASNRDSRPEVSPEDLEYFNESVNILVYGHSGVGKTPFAGGLERACFISTEKGTISAKRFGSTAKLMKAPTWEHLEAALDYVDENPNEFDWIIIDSITKMQVLLLRYLLRRLNEENPARDLDIPAIKDHQKWQNMYKRFIDRLIDMAPNVMFIATAMDREDSEGEDLVLPQVEGKGYAIAQYVCAQMDAVWYLYAKSNPSTGEPTWFMYTKTTPPYFAKDRYNALPVKVKRPNVVDCVNAVLSSYAESNQEKPDPEPPPARRSRTQTRRPTRTRARSNPPESEEYDE